MVVATPAIRDFDVNFKNGEVEMRYLKKATISMLTLLFISGIFNNAFAAAPLARIVVAKSGGNYTTITAALNAITPTATNRYVIEVWPGTYTEPSDIVLKSYVHLKGSGRDVTTVKTTGTVFNYIIVAADVTDVTISGLTITGGAAQGRGGIFIAASPGVPNSVTVTGNTISNNIEAIHVGNGNPSSLSSALIVDNNILANTSAGIGFSNASGNVINNFISGNGSGNNGLGAVSFASNNGTYTQVARGNTISGNNSVGVTVDYTSAIVADNIISNNSFAGIQIKSNANGLYTNNKVINNGGALYTDIDVTAASQPNLSLNIFNDITGSAGVGSYNVNSNGDPILVP